MMNSGVFFSRRDAKVVHVKSRDTFKLALRWCGKNKFKIKSQAMATKLAKMDTRGFGKEIRSTKTTKSKLPHAVDEIMVNAKLLKCSSISSDIGSTALKTQNQNFT